VVPDFRYKHAYNHDLVHATEGKVSVMKWKTKGMTSGENESIMEESYGGANFCSVKGRL
jgi:hypothetical protein